jgi:hypothetical protein
MKISNLRVSEIGESVVLSAKCNIRYFGSDIIYFKLDNKYKNFIVKDYSPFVSALIVPCMKLGEDLIIEGNVSEELYAGIKRIIEKLLSWNIGLKPIAVIPQKLVKDKYFSYSNAAFFLEE